MTIIASLLKADGIFSLLNIISTQQNEVIPQITNGHLDKAGTKHNEP